jgi:hypothetical protein
LRRYPASRRLPGNPIMDLQFKPEDIAFRDEVRQFLQTQYPDRLRNL